MPFVEGGAASAQERVRRHKVGKGLSKVELVRNVAAQLYLAWGIMELRPTFSARLNTVRLSGYPIRGWLRHTWKCVVKHDVFISGWATS